MTSWFSRKKPANTDDKLKLVQLEIENNQRVNSDLRRKLEEVREAARRNKILLDELLHTAGQADQTLAQLKGKIEGAEITCTQQEAKIQTLLRTKTTLENRVFPTSLAMTSSSGQSVQEILDLAENEEEQIFFKDSKGQTWEIVKRSDLAFDDEGQSSSDLSLED
mmetsp:Transcript_26123/g.46456  ORF Transcript_26123/g.46456 Transcript_26123/m.46456 type:complete len:165 (+) Transcript_26123:365-859(+)